MVASAQGKYPFHKTIFLPFNQKIKKSYVPEDCKYLKYSFDFT